MSGPFGAGALNLFSGVKKFYPYDIDQSVRFNDNDSAYLSRTPSSAGNRKTWTWAAWVKRGNIGSRQILFSADDNASNATHLTLEFQADNNFRCLGGTEGASSQITKETSMKFNDAAAWYHLVFVMDATNTVARLYVNGDEITDWNTNNNPTNQNYQVNATSQHFVGRFGSSLGTSYFDGYMAEVHFVDGTALTPTSFGETKEGIWIPKEYTGSYGTNGFHLAFGTSSALGDDTSGNTNDFTATNLAATDQMPDSPTNSFSTLNPLLFNTTPTLQEGNLEASLTSGTGQSGRSRLGSTFSVTSGKWYWELTLPGTGAYVGFGISRSGFRYMLHTDPTEGVGFASFQTQATAAVTFTAKDGTGSVAITATGPTVTNIIQIALDADDGKMWIGDGTNWYSGDGSGDITGTSGDPAAGTNASFTGLDFSEAWTPMLEMTGSNKTQSFLINFGQDSSFTGTETAQGNTDSNGKGDFYYSPPSGYLALCAANLPDPGIDPNAGETPADYFNTVLYSGNGSTNNITGVGFQPDWVWLKNRSGTKNHQLFDSVRGVNKSLVSNGTGAEDTSSTDKLTSFDSDGFSLGSNTTPNTSSQTYVAWNWKAGGTAVSNTDGSITSSVSASPESGFSIVSYTTTTTSSDTVGHGLNSAPQVIFTKDRDNVLNWFVFTTAIDGSVDTLKINLTDAANNTGGTPAITSTTFTTNYSNVRNTIAYCFHSVEGYSKIGVYEGNADANGTFVYTGFRPAWVLFKRVDNSTASWVFLDNKRDVDNPVQHILFHTSADELSPYDRCDFVSNGFKLRDTGSGVNNADTILYLAFAEQPFKYANAR